MKNKNRILIMGAGGWGTALAVLLSKKFNIKIWCYEQETYDEIALNRTNQEFLPNIELPVNIFPVSDIAAIKDADIIINTIPTQFIRTTYSQVDFSVNNKIFINGAKGIVKDTLTLIPSIFFEVLHISPTNYATLSGPSHSIEVATNIPTAVTVASSNNELAKFIRNIFNTQNFRIYSNNDVIGTELGGAMKNVIAIAFGIAQGLNLGDNTKAMTITRGLAEITRLGSLLGANPHTFSGLSGLGDLAVTCYSKYSRNRKVGESLGIGLKIDEIISQSKMIAEGIETTFSAHALAKKWNIELPLTEHVFNVIYKDLSPQEAVAKLLQRKSKDELW